MIRKMMLGIGIVSALTTVVWAGVEVDQKVLGESFGGWVKQNKTAAEYPLSGATYRTYRPEVSKTPDGGLFVSLRIDHIRGWLSNNDHAMLEVTFNDKGNVVSAQSTIAIQGRSISSDLIVGVNDASKAIVGSDRAVQVGTDLVANLTAKLLRENIVEAGRVSFPAVLKHNYNLLYQAVRIKAEKPPAKAIVVEEEGGEHGESQAIERSIAAGKSEANDKPEPEKKPEVKLEEPKKEEPKKEEPKKEEPKKEEPKKEEVGSVQSKGLEIKAYKE